MLLIPVVALKLGSVAWRMGRYYLGAEEYVRRGPPHPFLRTVVSPIAVASTVALFGTGVALLALDQREGTIVGLHKASFLVWLGALGIHVLVRVIRLPGALRARLPGASLRIAAAAVALVAGGALATLTFPAADRLQDAASEHIGFDAS